MGRSEYRSTLLAVLIAVGIVTAIGCSDSGGMVELAGKVTIGGEPVAQGTIGFFPADGQGPSAEAVIDEGSYALSLPTGKKSVIIHGYKKVGEHYPWGKNNPPAPILKEIVQHKDQSDREVDVDVDRADLDFAISSSD